jgi:uracil phosphoribosyltransferase
MSSTSNLSYGKNVHISNHPVLNHKTSVLRSSTSDQQTFRAVLREVTYHLGYEATSTLKTREIPISVSIGRESNQMECMGSKVADRVALIPILRTGLGMTDGMLELLPQASIHHIGMYHLPGSAPVQYFNRLPKKCDSDIAYVVDPVIASAETMMAVIAILKKVCNDTHVLFVYCIATDSSFL